METAEDVEITEKDVIEMMDQFTRVPPLLLKIVVFRNSNVIKSFQNQIEDYKNKLSNEEIVKLRKVLKMPVEDLQDILNKAYAETQQEQLKILADPKAQPFITKNLQELEKLLF